MKKVWHLFMFRLQYSHELLLGNWGTYNDAMVICIWKDINTFHSEVHKVIQDIVPTEYGLLALKAKTLVEYIEIIKAKASKLSNKFYFLQGE